MKTVHQLLHPSSWKAAAGYSNGVAASGRLVFCGGLIGWNARQEFESDDFVEQAAQTFRNIVAVLAEEGAKPEHLVRLTWYVASNVFAVLGLRALYFLLAGMADTLVLGPGSQVHVAIPELPQPA